MARVSWCDESVYRAAGLWGQRSLRDGRSLFTDQPEIWTADAAEHLEARIGVAGDARKFIDKLQDQLRGLPDPEILLGAEVLFVELLGETSTGSATKRAHVEAILSLLQQPVEVDPVLAGALDGGGVADYGAGMAHRHAYLRFILRFARACTTQDRTALLIDPWRFRDFLKPLASSVDGMQANALLHLMFPDTFESVISSTHRTPLVASFSSAPSVAAAPDDDRKIAEVRKLITREGQPPVDLYSLPFRNVWLEPPSAAWQEMAKWAARLMEWPRFDDQERDFKLRIADRLRPARDAVRALAPDWLQDLRRAFGGENKLTSFYAHGKFLDWCSTHEEQAHELLAHLWTDEPLDVRLPGFLAALPREAVSGPGTRLSIASFLLLADDPTRYPFLKWTPYIRFKRLVGEGTSEPLRIDDESTYRLEDVALRLGIDGMRVRQFLHDAFPRDDQEHGAPWHLTADQARQVVDHFGTGAAGGEVAVYAEWMMLLEELSFRTAALGVPMRDLLDAQGAVWWIFIVGAPEEWDAESRAALERFSKSNGKIEKVTADGMFPPLDSKLEEELNVPLSWLQETLDLLQDKRQLILFGPPGTGKTFIAKLLSEHLTSNGGEHRIVQFHPSYTYEDFFEGYRPQADESTGHLMFKLVGGALRELAELAREHPERPYVLLIDEINRGNIAKIFGELYFLLEYRDEEIRLQYRPESTFSLPKNLFVIGTMNTADRSIALVDNALRRRFYFRSLLPTEEPIKSVLGKWLGKRNLDQKPAKLLDALNAAIANDNFSIGPSYFITADAQDGPNLERVWKFALEPLLEEHFFGTGRDIGKEFGLAALEQKLAGEAATSEGEAASGS